MRYLIFTNTPAHVHLYKHVVDELRHRGHEVIVLARDYGCTLALAEAADLPYRVYGECDTTKWSLFRNLPKQYLRLFVEARRFDPDVVFGMGAYAAPTGAFTGACTILILDSEPTTLDHRISKPFADALLTPASFRRDLGPNHYKFQGFKEGAYLHPDIFESDATIRTALDVVDDPFVILRLNAFGSHHDVAHEGFSDDQIRRLIDDLAEHATVLISDEGRGLDAESTAAQPFDLHPARLHDALAEASLLVADTQTMVTEAALLGTPAIRSNSFVGGDDMGNFIELADRGLVHNLQSFDDVQRKAIDILRDDRADERWQSRRQDLLSNTVNLTDTIVEIAEHPHSITQAPGVTQYREPPRPEPESSSIA